MAGPTPPSHSSRYRALQQRDQGLTKSQMAAIAFSQLVQAVQITMPFTIAVYMVRMYEAHAGRPVASTGDEQRVARLTGFLASVFQAAQMFTSFLLGRLSDTIGRKPVLVLGNVAGTLSMLAFGLAGDFAGAAWARFVGGLFNGVIGALKTIIGESCDAAGQATALGLVSLAWGIGSLLGPTCGGVLADPCNHIWEGKMGCMPGQLFEQRPFALPCIVAALLSLVATIVSVVYLEETLPALTARPSQHALVTGALSALRRSASSCSFGPVLHRVRSSNIPRNASFALRDVLPVIEGSPWWAVWRRWSGNYARVGHDDDWGDAELELQHKDDCKTIEIDEECDSDDQPLLAHRGSPWKQQQNNDTPFQPVSAKASMHHAPLDDGSKDSVLVLVEEVVCEQDRLPWYRMPQVYVALGGYGLIACTYSFLDELLPLFAAAPPPEGGLGWPPNLLALPLSFSGVVIMVYAMLIYPRLQRLLGVVWCVRLGLVATVFVAPLAPLASLFQHYRAQQLMTMVATGCKALAGCTTFTACMVIVNVIAPREAMGAVNGVGQTIAAFVRAAGPAMAGVMWSASLGLAWVGHQFLPFSAAAVAAVVTQVLYLCIKCDHVL